MNTRSAFQFLRIVLGLVLLSSLVLGDFSPASTAPLRCYVKRDATGLNNGSSWANAYNGLQSALGASLCTEVWVARGTYRPTVGPRNRTVSFVLKSGVAIYGGFAGKEVLLSKRNPMIYPTILSGDVGFIGVDADNSYHVVVGSNTNSTALLDGFTIAKGYANGGYPNERGGGMYNDSGSPTLKNITFTNNSALYGAGMFNDQNVSQPGLENVTFTGNHAIYVAGDSGGGGGMLNNRGSRPVLINVTFSGNHADKTGGGMDNRNGSRPTLTNVTFSGNYADKAGGGIYNRDTNTSSIITNSILYGDGGGEIFNENPATATVSLSIVQGGYAGIGNLDADPLLGSLKNNGGFTQTRMLGDGSPAVDTGNDAVCPPKDQRGVTRPRDGDGNGSAICDMGATELPEFLTSSFQSAGSQDGWVLESAEASGVGGSMNASQATFALGDDKADRQGRSILSFNTTDLPDDAVIVSAVLKIKKAGAVGTNPFRTHGKLLVDVRRGTFSNNAALQLQDFQAAAHKNGALSIKNNPVDGWYSGTMGAANFTYINKQGVTQFRLRFAKDDNDDFHMDYIKFYSGNCLTTTYWPQLIIQYYIP